MLHFLQKVKLKFPLGLLKKEEKGGREIERIYEGGYDAIFL